MMQITTDPFRSRESNFSFCVRKKKQAMKNAKALRVVLLISKSASALLSDQIKDAPQNKTYAMKGKMIGSVSVVLIVFDRYRKKAESIVKKAKTMNLAVSVTSSVYGEPARAARKTPIKKRISACLSFLTIVEWFKERLVLPDDNDL
jgi:hypothetical protein